MVQSVGWRNHEAIRLHGLINAADVTADDQTATAGPCGLTVQQFRGPLMAFNQQFVGAVEFPGIKEFVVVQRTADGALEDHHVREQCGQIGAIQAPDLLQLLLQTGEGRAHGGSPFFGHRNPFRRNPPDVFGDVILGAVREGG